MKVKETKGPLTDLSGLDDYWQSKEMCHTLR